ncbi:hypothetical protein ACT6NV_06430 [Robiginitalea sp. IMCC44478]|uniref:hypothetical protein n=1 Tax=Robiginitalea sp. IMCC44478 TaxID=3459122 RepID=UPI004041B8DF
MKQRNILPQFGWNTLCLVVSAILIASLVAFVGASHENQTHFLERKNDLAAEWSALRLEEQQLSMYQTKEDLPVTDYAAYTAWKGDFTYKLEYREELYDYPTEFMKMKGLRGESTENIEVTGHIVFTQAKKKVRDRVLTLPGHFAGKGTVSYTIARMSLSKLGEGLIVHLTDGKGKDQIKRRREDTYLKINRASKTYSIRITPGSYEADIDAFGVKVLKTTENKVTRAFIEKMESIDRPVLYPEAVKEMFPEYVWRPDRDNIVLEAFDIPFSRSTNTLSGSYKDEKGGVLSWKFVAF